MRLESRAKVLFRRRGMHKSWLVALALMTVAEAGAVSINIGTALNASSWTIDSDGFTFTAFQDGSAITVTSTGNRLGSTVTQPVVAKAVAVVAAIGAAARGEHRNERLPLSLQLLP